MDEEGSASRLLRDVGRIPVRVLSLVAVRGEGTLRSQAAVRCMCTARAVHSTQAVFKACFSLVRVWYTTFKKMFIFSF